MHSGGLVFEGQRDLPGPGGIDRGRRLQSRADRVTEDLGKHVLILPGPKRGDLAGIAALLTPNASLRMRPLPVEYRGRSAARHFLAAVAFPGGTPSYRLIATRANGQPAFGCYLRDPAAGVDHACGLVVLTVAGGRITAIDRFVDNSMLPRFGLPRTLPEDR